MRRFFQGRFREPAEGLGVLERAISLAGFLRAPSEITPSENWSSCLETANRFDQTREKSPRVSNAGQTVTDKGMVVTRGAPVRNEA